MFMFLLILALVASIHVGISFSLTGTRLQRILQRQAQALQPSSVSYKLFRVFSYATPGHEDDGAEEEEDEDNEEEEDEDNEEELDEGSSTQVTRVGDGNLSLVKGIQYPTALNGSEVRVGIIMTRWNTEVIQGLFKGVNESLAASGVKPKNIFSTYVPGAYELPITAKFLTASKRFDVIICLGCLIKGETMHFEYIAQATANGIMQVALESFVPCIFGVLTVLNKDQAIKRCSGETNEGLSWGKTAVEMGLARMSALGMDKQNAKKERSQSIQFVNFNSTLDEQLKANSNHKPNKKFGF